jgi:hypothetical protein
MPHAEQNIATHHHTDARYLRISIRDEDGNAYSVASALAEWHLKENAGDDDADALLSKTVSGGGIELDTTNDELIVHIQTGDTEGIVDWANYENDTADLYHVARMTNSNGNLSTVAHGTFTITKV